VSIDAVGTGGIMQAAATSVVATGAPDVSRQVSAGIGATENKEDIKQMIDQIQSHIKMMNVSLEFSTYGNHGEKISVVVADKDTGEVIREIPAKELQNLYAKMSELAGMIFNIQI
jgi:flagellar protein FlaG